MRGKKNLYLVLILLLLAAGVLLIAQLQPKTTGQDILQNALSAVSSSPIPATASPTETVLPETAAPTVTAVPVASSAPATDEPTATPAPSTSVEEMPHTAGVIRVTSDKQVSVLFLPEEGELSVPITREENGVVLENVVHLTPNSMTIESANCDNQDCVGQGTVTLDNLSSRILGNMIVCLPHKLALELYPLEDEQTP